jgi:hypothetical protein
MKEFRTINFDAAQCRKELDQFQQLLTNQRELSERNDLQTFRIRARRVFRNAADWPVRRPLQT